MKALALPVDGAVSAMFTFDPVKRRFILHVVLMNGEVKLDMNTATALEIADFIVEQVG